MEEKRSEQELVRIGKLEKYKELGIDPFGQKYDVKNKLMINLFIICWLKNKKIIVFTKNF